MHKIFFTKKAEKELNYLSSIDKKRILEKIHQLAFPFSLNLDIKKLINISGFYRLRIGKIRIIFEIIQKKKEIWIRKIGYRANIYRLS